jgi:K+-sensing histidine kinase KdpD
MAYARPTPAAGQSEGAGGAAEDDLAEESIGLGLGLAHGLIAAMGGELSVGDSSPRGTSMRIRLPHVPSNP